MFNRQRIHHSLITSATLSLFSSCAVGTGMYSVPSTPTTFPSYAPSHVTPTASPSTTTSPGTPTASPVGSVPPATSPSSPAAPASPSAAFSPTQFKGFPVDIAQSIASSLTKAKFDEFDKDKDGALNASELGSYLNLLPISLFGSQSFQVKQTQLSSSDNLLATYDANKDQKLSLAELQKLLGDLLAKQVVFNFPNVKTSNCAESLAGFTDSAGIIRLDVFRTFFQDRLGLTLSSSATQALSSLGLEGKTVAAVCGTTSTQPSQLPPKTDDISTFEKTTFNGKVFDDTNAPLDGAKVTAKSLNTSVVFNAETVTAGGTYAFNDVPAGIQLEIIATKAGYTTRRRVEVLKSNKEGDPNGNKYDFGTDGSSSSFGTDYNALSDKPEVTTVSPGRNASGVAPNTNFVLKWSEPMDRKSAEDLFTVRAFNSRQLTVDAGSGSNTFTGDGQLNTLTNDIVWDKNAFNVNWNSDETEVTFTFKDEKILPTDKDLKLIPDYQVLFRDVSANRIVKDKAGISRNTNHFKLTDGPFEESYKFSIKTDEIRPEISSVTAQTAENQGENGDAIKVKYSEPMILYTKTQNIAGGMEDRKTGGVSGSEQKAPAAHPSQQGNATSSNTAKNYTVTITKGNPSATTYNSTWHGLGGTVVYDTNDPTHKTVMLLPFINMSGSTFNNFVRNGNPITTQATTNPIALDNVNNVLFLQFNLRRNIASLTGASVTTADLDTGVVTTAAELATNIQNDLNSPAKTTGLAVPTSANPWTVTASADSKQLTLVFQDTSGHYLGFNMEGTSSFTPGGGDVYPANSGGNMALVAGSTQTLAKEARLDVYQPGDAVKVKASSTIQDPAGNTINTSQDNATGNAS